MSRRSLLRATVGAAIVQHAGADAQTQTQLVFPRHAGAHPDYKTEWWYATGCINGDESNPLFGFQVTFFEAGWPLPKHAVPAGGPVAHFMHAAVTDIRGKNCGTTSAWPGRPS